MTRLDEDVWGDFGGHYLAQIGHFQEVIFLEWEMISGVTSCPNSEEGLQNETLERRRLNMLLYLT